MPLHHAVLALLADRPAHGYELKTSFEQAVGDQWGGLNIGHLYQILDRLARDGVIDSERQPQQVKPDRVIHRLTPAGRAELGRWLAEPAIPARGYRDASSSKPWPPSAPPPPPQPSLGTRLPLHRVGDFAHRRRGYHRRGCFPARKDHPVLASLALRARSHPDHRARHRLDEQLPLQQRPFRRTPLVTCTSSGNRSERTRFRRPRRVVARGRAGSCCRRGWSR